MKRHGYYCRSRKAGGTTRSRSCTSCAKGKARCDNRHPECSRCITKGITCHYPAKTPKDTGPRIKHSDDTPTERREAAHSSAAVAPSIENRQEASNDGDISLNGALVISDAELANIREDHFDWDGPDIDFADFLNSQTNDEAIQYPSLGLSSLSVRHSTASTDQAIQVQQAISSPNVSIPTLPTSTFRSFIQRPKMQTGAQRIANLTLRTLKSYPLMMQLHNTFPPFIHPRLMSSDIENNHMEPLHNCMSLVHMISSGIQGSRKLFWKNVRLECERFCGEVRYIFIASRKDSKGADT